MTIEQAIARSTSHNEIVHLPWSGAAQNRLVVVCEDWVDAGNVREFWGTDDEGDSWRIHLDYDADSDSEERADYERDRDIDDEITGAR